MTTLNTIIEEEKKWEDDFRKQYDELKLKPPKGSIPGAERELIIWYFRNRITTAMQRAYEAGEREADAKWEREVELMRIPLDVHKNGGILTRKEIVINDTLDTILSKLTHSNNK